MAVFNSPCSEYDYEAIYSTLATLRVRLLRRLGFSAQAANPPPGMAELLNDFLQSAQTFLYRRYKALQTERFFEWMMVPGERFYGVRANDDACSKKLDSYKITGAWVEDLNGAWLPLTRGIDPIFYTGAEFEGFPARYEIRQYLEVFPAPSAAFTLRVRGHFGLQAFSADTDRTTLDSELVFLWALANAKNHYGAADARDVASQATTYLKDLIAATHEGYRYVPGTIAVPPLPQPIFLPLVTP